MLGPGEKDLYSFYVCLVVEGGESFFVALFISVFKSWVLEKAQFPVKQNNIGIYQKIFSVIKF